MVSVLLPLLLSMSPITWSRSLTCKGEGENSEAKYTFTAKNVSAARLSGVTLQALDGLGKMFEGNYATVNASKKYEPKNPKFKGHSKFVMKPSPNVISACDSVTWIVPKKMTGRSVTTYAQVTCDSLFEQTELACEVGESVKQEQEPGNDPVLSEAARQSEALYTSLLKLFNNSLPDVPKTGKVEVSCEFTDSQKLHISCTVNGQPGHEFWGVIAKFEASKTVAGAAKKREIVFVSVEVASE